MAERVTGDEHPSARLAEDEPHFLGSVEVDDGHGDGAEQRDRPERARGLGPVGQLERDRLAGLHPVLEQAGGDAAGIGEGVGIGAAPGSHLGAEAHDLVGHGAEPVGEDRPECLVGPRAVGHVAAGAVGVVGSQRQVQGA